MRRAIVRVVRSDLCFRTQGGLVDAKLPSGNEARVFAKQIREGIRGGEITRTVRLWQVVT